MKKMTNQQFRERYTRTWFLFKYGSEIFLIIGSIMLGVVLYETYSRTNRNYLFWAGLILIMFGILVKEALKD